MNGIALQLAHENAIWRELQLSALQGRDGGFLQALDGKQDMIIGIGVSTALGAKSAVNRTALL